jgi:hypothetical protein
MTRDMSSRVRFIYDTPEKPSGVRVRLAAFWAELKRRFRRPTLEPLVDPERQVTIRRGVFIRRCRLCLEVLGADSLVACSHNPKHQVHQHCATVLGKGQCPYCGHALDGTLVSR